MSKSLILILSFFAGAVQVGFSAQHFVTVGASVGNGYNSGFVTASIVRPNSFGFGADLSLFSFTEKDTSSKSYFGAIYTQNKLFEKYNLSADWILGATYSKTDYTSFSSDSVWTPGIGIAAMYPITPKWTLNGKALGVIYSDGYSIPYSFGVTYPVKMLNVGVGIQGLLSIINTNGTSSSGNSYGGMFFIEY